MDVVLYFIPRQGFREKVSLSTRATFLKFKSPLAAFSHTGQKELVLFVPLVLQLYSGKYPHASLRRSCARFSRDALDNSLPSLWVSRLTTGCHLLNLFHAIFPPWQLALTVFMQEVQSFIMLQLVHATIRLHLQSGFVQLVIFLFLCHATPARVRFRPPSGTRMCSHEQEWFFRNCLPECFIPHLHVCEIAHLALSLS